MRSLYLLALTLLMSGVAGCVRDSAMRAELVPAYTSYQVGEDRKRAIEFYLVDGTRCVMLNNIAVTCEWQRPVILVPRPQ